MRGNRAKPGDTNTSANGYHYTRTETKWRLTHHLIAEKSLGRPLMEGERVVFRDGDRSNLSPDNIAVRQKGKVNIGRRKAQIEPRIAELQAELEDLDQQS